MQWKNPLTRARLAYFASKIKNAGDAVLEVAHAVNDWGDKPKLRNYMAVGAIGISKLAELGNLDPEASGEMAYLDTGFSTYVNRLCEEVADVEIVGSGASKTRIYKLHGSTIIGYGVADSVELYCLLESEDRKEQIDKSLRSIGRAIWEKHGNFLEVTTKEGRAPDIRPWDTGDVLYSHQTESLLERINQFLDRGHGRSILLYGPPGTGKSCMTRAVASSLGMPTMYIGLDSLVGRYLLDRSLSLLHPYCVIIDDIDRCPNVGELLATIDKIRKFAKVVMVTVNNKGALDVAVTRAGRFDELVEVLKVRSVKDLIPGLPPKYVEEVDEWPVAFVEELKKRLEVLGQDSIEEEIQRLRPRVSDNDDSSEVDEADLEPVAVRSKELWR